MPCVRPASTMRCPDVRARGIRRLIKDGAPCEDGPCQRWHGQENARASSTGRDACPTNSGIQSIHRLEACAGARRKRGPAVSTFAVTTRARLFCHLDRSGEISRRQARFPACIGGLMSRTFYVHNGESPRHPSRRRDSRPRQRCPRAQARPHSRLHEQVSRLALVYCEPTTWALRSIEKSSSSSSRGKRRWPWWGG